MKQMRMGTKLIGGFTIVAFITLAVGLLGWQSIARLSGHLRELGQVRLPAIGNLRTLKKEAESTLAAQRTILNPELKKDDLGLQYKSMIEAREKCTKAMEVYEGLPKSDEESVLWEKFKSVWEDWEKENSRFLDYSRELDKTEIRNPLALNEQLESFRGDHYKSIGQAQRAIMTGESFEGGEDATKCPFGQWIVSYKTENPVIRKNLKAAAEEHDKFHKAIGKIKKTIKETNVDEALSILFSDAVPSTEAVLEALRNMRGEAERAREIYSQMNEQAMVLAHKKEKEAFDLLDQIMAINSAAAEQDQISASEEARRAKFAAFTGMGVGFGLALLLGIVLATSISRGLNRAIQRLTEASEQVASASNQVSSSSQSLAEGSSEQAASIEETSSALEEMFSMTKQNANNANQANELMEETKQIMGRANGSMGQLTASMEEITRASEETSEIIKTIDEIAFQTNLLALNAAVEAARAGEAGAGFAVVADEVRNLAMRAADAAKNTANLIEGTIKKVKDGSGLLGTTNQAFQEVSFSAAKVANLVSEIAAASSDQTQGIEQLNKAVAEMDKVVQMNAANAEESASASEELNAQAGQMKEIVGELVAMVGGAHGRGNMKPEQTVQDKAAESDYKATPPATRNNQGKALAVVAKNEVVPDEVIPFDVKDFKAL